MKTDALSEPLSHFGPLLLLAHLTILYLVQRGISVTQGVGCNAHQGAEMLHKCPPTGAQVG